MRIGWLVGISGLLASAVYGQTALPETVSVTADTPARITWVLAAGETITIIAQGSDTFDPTLLLLDEHNNVLAYADDTVENGERSSDSRLTTTHTGGTVTLVADSFNGVSAGDVRLIWERQPTITLVADRALKVTLRAYQPQTLRYTVSATQTIYLCVRDTAATLDPWVRVYAADGALLAMGDDSNGHPDLTLNLLDSVLELVLPDGEYTIQIGDWLGRAGQVEVTAATPTRRAIASEFP